MKLAVSSFAWPEGRDAEAAQVLSDSGLVSGVELVLPKTFSDPADVSTDEVRKRRQWWSDRGLPVVSVQSLAFGRAEAQLFGTDAQRLVFHEHLVRMADVAVFLGARCMVFGSPANRKRGSMALDVAMNIATAFFQGLADAIAERDLLLCIEPNPPIYAGCDFVTDTKEAIALVERIACPAIRVQCDTGAMAYAMAQEQIPGEALLRKMAGLTGHIHISAPGLPPITDDLPHQSWLAQRIAALMPDAWISIEMMHAPNGADPLMSLRTAIDAVALWYPIDPRR